MAFRNISPLGVFIFLLFNVPHVQEWGIINPSQLQVTAYQQFPDAEAVILFENTYVISLQLPKNYQIKSLPENTVVKFPENYVRFEFIAGDLAGTISLRTKLSINHPYFISKAYPFFRELYDNILKKEAEKIFLKKVSIEIQTH